MAEPGSKVLRRFPYGFYSITSTNGDEVNAMVANWLTQVSFEPRLIALGLQKTSYSHGLIEEGGVFNVNLFLKDDSELIKPFTKSRSKNPEKMHDVDFTLSPETKCPILDGAAAYIECQVIDIHPAGDHDVVIGKVIGGEEIKPGDSGDSLTLEYLGWSYSG
jgi:flavin reductase (DIM6/NTAB) family NADH-FMN oxidoreductase RutF